jgi:hypothetical protein
LPLFPHLCLGEHDIRIPITRNQLQDLCSEELKVIQKTITEFQKKHTDLNLESLEVILPLQFIY